TTPRPRGERQPAREGRLHPSYLGSGGWPLGGRKALGLQGRGRASPGCDGPIGTKPCQGAEEDQHREISRVARQVASQKSGRADMSNTIVNPLNELRSQPAWHLRSKTLASSNDVAQEKVWARYHEAVAGLRRVWGEPELGPTGRGYEGPGWRAGYQGDCPSPDEYFRPLYCQSLRIGWWQRAGLVHAVMITGHDANTLQILQLAVAKAREA